MQKWQYKSMRHWACIVFLLAALAGSAEARQQPSFGYDIGGMPVRDALVSLAKQAKISISFNNLDLYGYQSRPVVGEKDVTKALTTILADTPYGFVFTASDTVKLTFRDIGKIDASLDPNMGGDDFADVVFVTATKRMANPRTLPISISSLDYNALSRWDAKALDDLAPRIAGVSFTNLGTGRNKIFVRGLSDGSFADRTLSTVGVYLDETPLILNDTNPDLRLLDIERVEVVRGPQGSLYGGGSIGGLFRMITNKPNLDEFSGKLQVSGSKINNGGANGAVDGVINLPFIEDKLGLRALAYYQKTGGYINDIGLGLKNINRAEIAGGRADLRAQPTDDWTVDFSFNRQLVDLDGAHYIFPELGGLRRSTARREPHRDAFNLANITAIGGLGDAQMTVSSSYIHRTTDSDLDATAKLPVLIGDPDAEGVYRSFDEINTYIQEIRLVSDDNGKWRWLVGADFTNRNERLRTRLINDAATPAALAFFSNRDDRYFDAALFGEASYNFTDKLRMTLGGRLARSVLEVRVRSGGVVDIGASRLDKERRDFRLTPKFALSYQQSPEMLIYLQIAMGTRLGGVNVTTPLKAIFDGDPKDATSIFESDTLWNSEIGVKAYWFNGKLELNTAAFYVKWNDVQTDQILPSGFSFIANAGRAQNYGFEGEITARPTSNLELSGAFFWNSPELTRPNPFLGAAPGDALPNIASISAGVAMSYEAAISRSWRAVLTSDYSYVGRSFLTFRRDVAPVMGDYFVGNIRLAAQRDDFSLGVFVENLADERGNTFSFGNPFSLSEQSQETPLQPRTIGVFVQSQF